VLYRRVEPRYAPHYDRLIASGLYEELRRAGRLVAHEEAPPGAADADAYRLLRPEPLPFISYPYEWCLGQLREAALLTLEVMRAALGHGMVLKDASAYNVQFVGTRPVLVDTLSFELYREGEPWIAYRQFCEHFLAPLALAAGRDPRLLGLLRAHLDGIPLDLASGLLPRATWLRFGLLSHLHLHARAQGRLTGATGTARKVSVTRRGLEALLESLAAAVSRLAARPRASHWAEYGSTCTYSAEALQQKAAFVQRFLRASRPRLVFDLGANTGAFSRLAAEAGAFVVSIDADLEVVERSYARARAEREERVLPLAVDLANPSPGLGWDGGERPGLAARGPADVALALALVHHLALRGNVPLPLVAASLRRLARRAIVEFVPREDPQAERLVALRGEAGSHPYDRTRMEEALASCFRIAESVELTGSQRVLYWCEELP
jgi:SAM-dependent methyltransferase